jgi:hypothetical protein
MDYQRLYDILQETLTLLPTDIINRLIFRYIVNSNKYVLIHRKYNIQWILLIHNIHYNKHLGIICCDIGSEFKLINFHNGKIHDNTRIDSGLLNMCIKTPPYTSKKIIYFNSDIILVRNESNSSLCTYILDKCRYELLNRHEESLFGATYVYNNNIYIINATTNRYWFIVYNLYDFKRIKESRPYDYHEDNVLKISIYNDTIYIHEHSKIGGYSRYYYAHDIKNFIRFHEYKCPYECFNPRMYNDKLYLYHYKSQYIFVYDIMMFELINCIYVDIDEYASGYSMIVSDGLIALFNCNNLILYEIKNRK